MKVFVLCPADAISGGPEALHQLTGALLAKGVDARIVYYPSAAQVPKPYRVYEVAVADVADDGPRSVVVVPEAATSLAWRYPAACKIVWWLSVDNFFKWRHLNPGPSVFQPRPDLWHLCQSIYARDFLLRQGVRPLGLLTDYVTEGVFSPGAPAARAPVITYNPKKAPETTRRLMGGGRDWLALDGFSKTQLAAVLRQARVYVDFGPHPGRDRIPREAALSGAVVITGRRGAAAFGADVPLPARFRLDERAADFEAKAGALLDEVLGSEDAFVAASAEQAGYRAWIERNQRIFMAEVDSLIDVMANLAAGSASLEKIALQPVPD